MSDCNWLLPVDWKEVMTGVVVGVALFVFASLSSGTWLLIKYIHKLINKNKIICIRCGEKLPRWFGKVIVNIHLNTIDPYEEEFKCYKCQKIIKTYPHFWNWPFIRIRAFVQKKREKKIAEESNATIINEDELLDIKEKAERRKRMMNIIKRNK